MPTRNVRWKLLQFLEIKGENDHNAAKLRVTPGEFAAFAEAQADMLRRTRMDVYTVREDNNQMTNSYLMMDPDGRMFQNTGGKYSYSHNVLKIGLWRAVRSLGFDPAKFADRGGCYPLTQ